MHWCQKSVQKSVLYVQTSCFALRSSINVCSFDILIAVAVVVVTALFWSEGSQCHDMEKSKMYNFVYSETTGY